jgi:hypothetical protein
MADTLSTIDRQALATARREFPQRRPPDDLCDAHKRIWLAWWDYADHGYNPLHPKDYGNLGPILDARTSHTRRRATWLVRGRADLADIERTCRSGSSPQCNRPKEG